MKIDWKVLWICGGLWMFVLSPLRGAGAVKNLSWQQRWPWNGQVDITYSVECSDKNWDGTPVDIKMSFVGYDRDLDRSVEMTTLSGPGVDAPVQAGGPYQVTWNADKDCPGFHSSSFKIRAMAVTQLKTQIAADQKQYLVIDLAGGASASSYPFRYSETGPDLSGELCRTTELWLRKIPAGTFIMGSPADEPGREANNEVQHQVTLTSPFYIGVFEVTQKQWKLVMEGNPSNYLGDDRPVECVSYDQIRGIGSRAGAGWPEHGHTVDADSFLGRLQTKTGLLLDLPTDAQWEYACRAGTVTSLNSGKNLTDGKRECPNMNEVGRNKGNRSDGRGGYSDGTTRVGCYRPNNWGLYDMHGNVWEWCLDWAAGTSSEPVVDPVGPVRTEGSRILRGGCQSYFGNECRSARRQYVIPAVTGQYDSWGFRLVCMP